MENLVENQKERAEYRLKVRIEGRCRTYREAIEQLKIANKNYKYLKIKLQEKRRKQHQSNGWYYFWQR